MATNVVSVDAFRKLLRKEIEEICSEEGWKFESNQGAGFGFQKWVGNLICAHEDVEEDKVTVFSTNDLKFDVISLGTAIT